jgi:tetratricopeptide (TPR) repeat protein
LEVAMQARSLAFGTLLMALILSSPGTGRAQAVTGTGGSPTAAAAPAPSPAVDPERLAAAMAAYRGRASMDRHREAWEAFVRLAAERPDDHGMQIWCARTSFYYAHRRVQADDKEGCARVARSGSECARRAQQIRSGDYDGRYWELMNRYKEGATLGLVAILKMVKPIRGWLEELIQRDPKRPEGHAFLAMAYRELPSVVSWGDDKKALEHARVAQQLAPREPEALLELAEALRENGEKDAARDMYRRVQTSDVPRDLEWETEDARAWARKQLADMD